jgi:hypothetical protein
MSDERYDCPDACECDQVCELNIYDDSWPSVDDLFKKEWKFVLAALVVFACLLTYGVVVIILWLAETGL